MASQGSAQYTGPDSIETLTADREKMWQGFTNATVGVIVLVIAVLIGMAVFLL